MIDLLVILLKPALLWESNPWRYWYLTPVTLVAWVVDVAIAHTTWALMYGWPKPYEMTISHTLERLCKTPGPDQQFLIEIAKKINRESPSGNHIKAVQHGDNKSI